MKIFNNHLEATFKTKGAELISLKRNSDDREFVWQADPEHWGRYAPILFPFVGKLKNNCYKYRGELYPMGQHGFARDMEFNLIDQEKEFIRFSFTSIDQTLKVYPFRFELVISYQLRENSLIVTYVVKNLGSPDLHFSIGGHPAFNCPLIKGEVRSDYWLEFDQEEKAPTHRLEGGLFSGKTDEIFTGNKIMINDSLFDEDALVFKHLKSDKATLTSPSGKWLTFHFKGFPYLGIWSKSDKSPFVCIEPWFGLADHRDHDQQIENKEGINVLEKSQTFECAYQIDIHNILTT